MDMQVVQPDYINYVNKLQIDNQTTYHPSI